MPSLIQLDINVELRDLLKLIVKLFNRLSNPAFTLTILLLFQLFLPISGKDFIPFFFRCWKITFIWHFYQISIVTFDTFQFFLDLKREKRDLALFLEELMDLLRNFLNVDGLQTFLSAGKFFQSIIHILDMIVQWPCYFLKDVSQLLIVITAGLNLFNTALHFRNNRRDLHLSVELMWSQLFLYLAATKSNVKSALLAVFDPRLVAQEVARWDVGMVFADAYLLGRGWVCLHFINNF